MVTGSVAMATSRVVVSGLVAVLIQVDAVADGRELVLTARMARSSSASAADTDVTGPVGGRCELRWRDLLREGRVSARAWFLGRPHGRKQRRGRSQPPVLQCLPPGHA